MENKDKFKGIEKIFTDIAKMSLWTSNESVSGPGSTLKHTKKIRIEIPLLIEEKGIKSILDIPCGDFNWMKHVKLSVIKYIGADIVKDLIDKNKRYENDKRSFMHLNLIEDELPKVDLILCRDCLIHFSFEDIFSAISNFKKSDSIYLLTTTFIDFEENRDIETGGWRPINLEKEPFNFPEPLKVINEGYYKNRYASKSLGLWNLEDVNIQTFSTIDNLS